MDTHTRRNKNTDKHTHTYTKGSVPSVISVSLVATEPPQSSPVLITQGHHAHTNTQSSCRGPHICFYYLLQNDPPSYSVIGRLMVPFHFIVITPHYFLLLFMYFFFFLNLCNSLLGLASVSVSPVWPRHSSIWHEGIITLGHKTGSILIWQGKQFNSISTVLLVTERHLCVGDRIQCPLFLYPSAKVTGAEVQHPFQKQLCSTTQLSVV